MEARSRRLGRVALIAALSVTTGGALVGLATLFPTSLPAVRIRAVAPGASVPAAAVPAATATPIATATAAAAAAAARPLGTPAAVAGAPASPLTGFPLPPGRPAWCDVLLADPRAAGDGGCRPTTPANCGAGAPPRFTGQFGQDAWLWSNHFKALRRPGVFFDVAANEAVDISNTYVFETCLGWKGICVEPNTRYLRALHDLRTCDLVPLCLSDVPKTVSFIDYLGLSGIADTNKNVNGSAEWQRRVRTAPRRTLECTTGGAVLRRAALTHVDFLSLDVEGAELEVLRGIDWDAVRIDVIALEEEDPMAGAMAFLVARGYKPVLFNAERKEDVLLFHPEVTVGEPTP
ncbi:hypothetical protein BU14_0389s0015 [Porphyra umbilicalis]|uniref:Methyltransferase FkbM domain-containing protein n=1 Tax=Porphyra umbilicalis TaxID=2786 RepID=A0A1X6NWJ9_PORUM|nr:hypothetical protein BU14_0389s0015 [Porphyra umbilicalis]|eukprot:OSX72991.1 hypothetical protein BU14_0389s0015 [Porphyra umbilicalis]